jgi:hypothetical protein
MSCGQRPRPLRGGEVRPKLRARYRPSTLSARQSSTGRHLRLNDTALDLPNRLSAPQSINRGLDYLHGLSVSHGLWRPGRRLSCHARRRKIGGWC